MHNVCKLSKPKSTNFFEIQRDEDVDNRIHLTGKDTKIRALDFLFLFIVVKTE